MTDEELATELCNAFWQTFAPGVLKNKRGKINSLDRGGWLAVLSRARALLTGATVGASLPSRADAAMKLAAQFYETPLGNSTGPRHLDNDWLAVADLALSWHVRPEPLPQDVEALAEWLYNQMPPADVQWLPDGNAARDWRTLATALIRRYGPPNEAQAYPVRVQENGGDVVEHITLNTLKPERDHLTAEVSALKHDNSMLMEINAELATDREKLTAENARLRAALEEILTPATIKSNLASLADEIRRLHNIARCAAEPAKAPDVEQKVVQEPDQWEVNTFQTHYIDPGWEPFHYFSVQHNHDPGSSSYVVCKRHVGGAS